MELSQQVQDINITVTPAPDVEITVPPTTTIEMPITNVGGAKGDDGSDGREIELQKSATHVQWRYVGAPSWSDLVPLADLMGEDGVAGSAATIAVGTVTTGAPGSSVIITNVGNSSAAVLNFTIPRGDTGAAGSGAPDADATTKGILRLAGDLGGTANSPTVPGLSTKEPTISAGTTSQYFRGDKSWQTLSKTTVGLSNVDNTSDANKPISTAMQAALDAKQGKARRLVGPNGDIGYITDGTADQVQIQAAINDAIAGGGGIVELQGVTFSVSAGISWDNHGVFLLGQGVGVTEVVATTNTFDIITIGNRQSSGIMRNFNHVENMTVTMAGGSSTKACIKIDGGGRGTSIKNVQTNEGAYGLQLIDLDRCFFENVDVNNVRTTAIYLQVGAENTYGTVTFLNCSMNLSDNSTTGMEFGNTAAQTSPNKFDRISLINCLFYSTTGLTGTKGIKFTVGATAFSILSSLFESTITHVQVDNESQLTFIGNSFMQNSGVSTNAFLLQNANHKITVQDCRFQALTNVFNGASGFSQVTLLGRNNNQGSITNIFTGNFGLRQGNDTGFAGNGILYLGTDNERFENAFLNQLRISGFSPTVGKVWAATSTNGDGAWLTPPWYTPGGADVAVADGGTGASSASAARINLGLVIGTDVQAYNANLTTWAGKTAPSGAVVGTTDSQTLSGKQLTNPSFTAGTTTVPFATLNTGVLLTTPVAGALEFDGSKLYYTVTGPTRQTVVSEGQTQTLSNKRVTPRVNSVSSGTTITPSGDSSDQYNVNALAANAAIAAPSGTPVSGQKLTVRIKDDGTPRTLTWNAIYRAIGVTIPIVTVANKVLYVGMIYNGTDTKWDVVAIAQEA